MDEFVQAVRRVLRPKKKGFFQGFWGAGKGETNVRQALGPLSGYREEVFLAFLVGIRSKLLDEAAALAVYSRLEELDTRYRIAFRAEDGLKELESLAEDYLYQVRFLKAISRASAPKPHKRDGQISQEAFRQLFQRVKKGQLGLDQLMHAPFLRVAPHHLLAGSPDYLALKREVWGP